jgi:ankyrin repeat protein
MVNYVLLQLLNAIYRKNSGEVSKLLKNNYDINEIDADGWGVLHAATYMNDIPMIEYLLNNGANIMHLNNQGESILQIATYKNEINMVKYLLSKGLDINQEDNDGDTILDNAKIEHVYNASYSYKLNVKKHNDKKILLKYLLSIL